MGANYSSAYKINERIGAKENYEMPSRLMEILKSKSEREDLFDYLASQTENLGSDTLRDYFQITQSARKTLKQDYTPDCIGKLIAEMASNKNCIIGDVCAGSGTLTIHQWNKNKNALFMCDEISTSVLPLLLVNMAMRNMNGIVREHDVLKNETLNTWELESGGRYSDIYERHCAVPSADLIVSNPPYSLKFESMKEYADDPRFREYGQPPASKADFAFVLDGLSRLSKDGEMFCILPHGVLFRGQGEGEIRKKLVENNLIDTVIGLPNKLFLNTSIPVFILVLKKTREDKNVLFIDASKEFTKGGKQNIMDGVHISKIAQAYKKRDSVKGFSALVSIEKIRDNEYNINIPRYVDTFIKPPVIDIEESITEVMKIEAEIAETKRELAKAIADMDGGDSSFKKARTTIINYQDFAMKALCEVAEYERAVNGKTYPEGTILIELSATKGVVKYCERPWLGDSRYAAVSVDGRYNPYYIYQSILNVFDEFIAKYKTTINLQFDALRFLKFHVHTNRATQDSIAAEIMLREKEIQREEQQIQKWTEVKEYFLDKMFPTVSP